MRSRSKETNGGDIDVETAKELAEAESFLNNLILLPLTVLDSPVRIVIC